jgi:hypothetical protein
MRIHHMVPAALILLLPGLTASPRTSAQEKKINRKDLPAAVLEAFQKSYPKAVIKGTSTEVEKGKKYFEIESLDGTQARDILYLADGTVAEIEESVSAADLPGPVTSAIAVEMPKAKISKAERVQKGADFSYEVHVKLGSKTGSIVLDGSGKVLEKSPMKAQKEKKEKEENEEEEDD